MPLTNKYAMRFRGGEYYIVQTKLRNIHYLRTTIMNPFTSKEHLDRLLAKVKELAEKIQSRA